MLARWSKPDPFISGFLRGQETVYSSRRRHWNILGCRCNILNARSLKPFNNMSCFSVTASVLGTVKLSFRKKERKLKSSKNPSNFLNFVYYDCSSWDSTRPFKVRYIPLFHYKIFTSPCWYPVCCHLMGLVLNRQNQARNFKWLSPIMKWNSLTNISF